MQNGAGKILGRGCVHGDRCKNWGNFRIDGNSGVIYKLVQYGDSAWRVQITVWQGVLAPPTRTPDWNKLRCVPMLVRTFRKLVCLAW